MLSRLGFTIRTFQEDNNHTPSWGYTVGLEVSDQPVCIFMRIPVHTQLLDSLLSDAAAMVQGMGIPFLPCHVGDFETTQGGRLRFKFHRMPRDLPDQLAQVCNNYIEGQVPGTKFYWLFAADPENKLPGEEGYVDWNQIDAAGNAVIDDDSMKANDLVDNFDNE